MGNILFEEIPDEFNDKLTEILESTGKQPFPVDEMTELLFDAEPIVRKQTARIIWEYSYKDFIAPLLEVANEDPKQEVRTRALLTFGKYIYEGEMEEYELGEEDRLPSQWEEPNKLTPEQYERIKSFLFATINNTDRSLKERRSALEALAFSTDDRVEEEIEKAYEREETGWVMSALFAMGRQKYSKWEPYVKECVPHEDEAILREAIRAAGELRVEELNEKLIELAREREGDIREEAILALGEIGSHAANAFEFLDNLALNSTGELKEIAESAVNRWTEVKQMYGSPQN